MPLIQQACLSEDHLHHHPGKARECLRASATAPYGSKETEYTWEDRRALSYTTTICPTQLQEVRARLRDGDQCVLSSSLPGVLPEPETCSGGSYWHWSVGTQKPLRK